MIGQTFAAVVIVAMVAISVVSISSIALLVGKPLILEVIAKLIREIGEVFRKIWFP